MSQPDIHTGMETTHDTPSKAALRSIARLLMRAPMLVVAMRVAFRVFQARFTAGVVGVIFNAKGEVLLVKHAFHPGCAWGLPGGWLNRAERPVEGLCRELQEEVGLEIEVLGPIRIDSGGFYANHLDIAFMCRTEGDVQHLSAELSDYRWVRPDDMPALLPFHRAALVAAASARSFEGFVQ